MESTEEIKDLQKRVKRLENVHIWGAGLILVGLLVFFLTKKGSGGSSVSLSDGGAIGGGATPTPTPNVGAGTGV